MNLTTEQLRKIIQEEIEAILLEGKKDACYHKVKARYDVWPSAYASGALVQCRKVGAKNWGNKSKKNEEVTDKEEEELEDIEDELKNASKMHKSQAKRIEKIVNEEEISEAEQIDKDKMACNKPKRTPKHPKKSHVVKACEDGKEKIIRFGEQGAETAGKPKKGESDRMKKKRKSFKARHAKNIKKGKMSAAYWADKVKWE